MVLSSALREKLAVHGSAPPRTLVVLGSGMGECFGGDELVEVARFATGVEGHSGRIGVYNRADGSVLVVFGRRHLYEGATSESATEVVRAAAELGVRNCILTNAAGGLDPLLQSGDVMLIDGILGTLLGSVGRGGGSAARGDGGDGDTLVRRPSLALRHHAAILERAWERCVPLRAGVYAALRGPSYETRAEIRMLRIAGAHAVGMSTALEAAEAAGRGMEVVALSLITNTLTDTLVRPLGHDEVIDVGARSTARVRAALEAALDVLHGSVG